MAKKKRLRVKWNRVFIALFVIASLVFGAYKSISWLIDSLFSNDEIVHHEEKPKPIQVNGTIVIDPGHGGMDAGAKKGNLYEKNIDLKVAKFMKSRLEEHGVKVVLTRDDDSTPHPESKRKDLKARATTSAKHNANYFISIHVNDFDGSQSVSGFEIYEKNENSHVLAQSVGNEVEKLKYSKNRGIVNGKHLQVLRDNTVPSILIELGYINGPDYHYLSNDEKLDTIAGAIVKGIVENLKK